MTIFHHHTIMVTPHDLEAERIVKKIKEQNPNACITEDTTAVYCEWTEHAFIDLKEGDPDVH